MEYEVYLTTGVIARKCDVTRQTVRTWVRLGWLVCDHSRKGRLYFTQKNLDDFCGTHYIRTSTNKQK